MKVADLKPGKAIYKGKACNVIGWVKERPRRGRGSLVKIGCDGYVGHGRGVVVLKVPVKALVPYDDTPRPPRKLGAVTDATLARRR